MNNIDAVNIANNILNLQSIGGYFLELDIENILKDIHDLYLKHNNIDMSNLVYKNNSRFPITDDEIGKKEFSIIIKYLSNDKLNTYDFSILKKINFFQDYDLKPSKGFLFSREFMSLLITKIYTLNNDNIAYIKDDENNFNYEDILSKYIDVDHYVMSVIVENFGTDAKIVYNYLLNIFNSFYNVFINNFTGFLLRYDIDNKISIYTTENILFNYITELQDECNSLKEELSLLKKNYKVEK